MSSYEKQVRIINKKNELYLREFSDYLEKNGLSDKTINKHISNVDYYINDFLNYYDANEMVKGCYEVNAFLGDWFIRKEAWATKTSVKENAASIKKFYKCMLELGHIKQEDFDNLCLVIKEEMDSWIDIVEK